MPVCGHCLLYFIITILLRQIRYKKAEASSRDRNCFSNYTVVNVQFGVCFSLLPPENPRDSIAISCYSLFKPLVV